MSTAEKRFVPFSHVEQLREARAILRDEAAAVEAVAGRLDTEFCAALELMHACTGRIVVTGMGKAGLVGRKIAATLSSLGSPAQFLHPAEAVHGDLGCLNDHDVVLALSNSGETEEVCRLLPVLRQLGVPVIAVTSSETSTLGRQAEAVVRLGRVAEAGLHRLAPSSSTTAMLALGDALALVLARMNGFTPQQFAVFHPGGSLGRRLSRVGDVMRRGDELRIADQTCTVREVFVQLSRPGRRTGAVMLVDEAGRLVGLFTDSDLARLLEHGRDGDLDVPVEKVMTERPLTAAPHDRLDELLDLLSERKVSEVPVVDEGERPIGLVDITDVIGILPHAFPDAS